MEIPMDPQAEVLALLADPATHGGAAVERIDTHISSVFLAGDRAYKLKKAVRLPFLDFSTLEARHAACLAELEVNRRAAPDLYLGVVPVVRRGDGRLELAGEGPAIDWVVVMRRFDGATLFDRLARQGGIDRHLVHRLTEAVVAFHRQAPVRLDRGGAAGLAWTIATNAQSMAPHVPHLLPAHKVWQLELDSRAWLARLAPLLDERRDLGLVRRCHGDLHLGNICMVDGRPTLFDAIEFSEDIACIDVFYDLAFLLMDLDVRASRDLASMAMNHALDLTGDYQALAALPLFLSLRAGVRALVSATIAAGNGGDGGEARDYLDAALAYLHPPAPRLVAVGGLSGSGKSRMGRELAPLLGVPGAAVVRSDALRKQLMGVGPTDRLGPDGYTPEVTARTYDRLLQTCALLLRSGCTVIADAVFARPDQRADMERVAANAGVPFAGLWLETDPDVAAERIGARKANVSDATVAVLEQQLAYDLGPITWTRIDTSGSREDASAAGRVALGL
jgi:uncharacterized protein